MSESNILNEILTSVEVSMADEGVENTPENRYYYLMGLYHSWLEENAVAVDAAKPYLEALDKEIKRLGQELNLE